VITIRPFATEDHAWATNALTAHFGGPLVARRGSLVEPLSLPGFVALVSSARAGLLTYAPDSTGVEVVTLFTDPPGRGVGQALMGAVAALVPAGGRLWLITTNPNTDALRFYQRWGMDLVGIHRDAVTWARTLKPSIPLAVDGIPLRHELELEWRPPYRGG